jgi:signal peptidase I
MSKIKKYLAPRYLTPFFGTLLVFIFIKSFIFDLVVVRSPSMQDTLKQGQWVFVRKLFTPERNDLVRISLPLSSKDTDVVSCYVFKRLVALAGDTVEIRNSEVLVNGKYMTENELFLHNYIVKMRFQKDTALFEQHGISERYLIDDSCVYMIPATRKKSEELKGIKEFSITSNAEDSAEADPNVFPYNAEFKWNEDYFGPLYIPKKGDTLLLDTSNIKIYQRIICDFENNSLEIEKDKIKINGIETDEYITRHDYYFVTGDNFDNSLDSRNWGFIPAKKIKSRLMFKL